MTTQAGTASPGRLTVCFVDKPTTLESGDQLTFGRSADLCIDNNAYLHRHVGRFYDASGSWWVQNVGSAIALTLVDVATASSIVIAPGAAVSIPFAASSLSFAAGGANYRLDLAIDPPPAVGADNAEESTAVAPAGEATASTADLPLTPEQRVLITALAEPWLQSGAPAELPTNRQVASTLGWSTTKFNRKLDAVCRKLAAGGVTGLVGTVDQLARDRRQRLVEHAVYAHLVTADDLALLAAYVNREQDGR